jgi:hypothetical protein
MPSLVEDTSGHIEYGLFFAIEAFSVDSWRDYSRAMTSGPIEGMPLNVETVALRQVEEASGWCQNHSDMNDIRRLQYLKVWIYGGETDGRVMGGMDGSAILVNTEVADALEQAKLRGTRFVNVEVEYNSSSVDEKTLRGVCFDGRLAYRPESVVPPEANACRVCGRVPFVCPICGHCEDPCPICGEITLSYGEQEASPSHIRVVPSFRDGRVISLSRWDGSDFVGGRIVTGRVIDVLFSFNPKVLCAQALRCHIEDGCATDIAEIRSQIFSTRYC